MNVDKYCGIKRRRSFLVTSFSMTAVLQHYLSDEIKEPDLVWVIFA